jgi:hypothetical protein
MGNEIGFARIPADIRARLEEVARISGKTLDEIASEIVVTTLRRAEKAGEDFHL